MIVALPICIWFAVVLALRNRAGAAIGWVLAISGIPMLGLVTWQAGPLWGFVALAVALMLLRAPFRQVRARARRAVE